MPAGEVRRYDPSFLTEYHLVIMGRDAELAVAAARVYFISKQFHSAKSFFFISLIIIKAQKNYKPCFLTDLGTDRKSRTPAVTIIETEAAGDTVNHFASNVPWEVPKQERLCGNRSIPR